MTRSTSPRALHASALRGPVLDGVAFVVCVVAMCVELSTFDADERSALGVAAIVVASLPVLLRRRAPIRAAALSMITMFGVLSTIPIYQTMPLPAVLCAYALASRHGRRHALWAGAATLPTVVGILLAYSPHSIDDWDTAKNLALVALPLALGVAAHDRRAYTAALVERAETAEQISEEETLRRVGEERLRIARDVHDVVAHAMVAINVQAGVGAHLLDRDPDQARGSLQEIKRVSGEALTDLRATLGLLREPDDGVPVAPTQGLHEIADLRDGLGSAGVDLALDIALDPGADPLPASVDATGYRIVQEALTNVMRHAAPTCARVRVVRDGDHVTIDVEDDGAARSVLTPSPLSATGSGNGLRGMRERAAAVGGSLEAGPRAEGGWRVSASLPVGAP